MTRAVVRLAAAVALVCLAACGGSGGGPSAPSATTADVATSSVAGTLTLTGMWKWPGNASSASVAAGMPAADGGDIAFTVDRQRVVMLDGQGKPRWEVRRDVRDVSPRFTRDLLLVPTEEGLVALERATGRERWSVAVGDRTNTPAVVGGRAVVTTWEGVMAAVNLADGTVAWKLKLAGNALGPPAASAASTAVATFDTGRAAGAVAVDVSTGRQRWSVPLPADGVSAPAIEGGTVVVVAADAAAHGLALDTGEERWRTPLDGSGSPEVPPLAQGDGRVVVGHRLGGMAMLRAGDGSVEWSSPKLGAAVRGGPAGPGPNGWYAMPLNSGRLALAGPDRKPEVREPPGLVIGVAMGPQAQLLVATGEGKENGLSAVSGW